MNFLNFWFTQEPFSFPNMFELFNIVSNSTTTKPQSQTNKVGLVMGYKKYHSKIIELTKKKIKCKVLWQSDLTLFF